MQLGGPQVGGPSEYLRPAAFFCAKVPAVYLLYLDDSGSVANKNEEYLVLGGISTFERQAFWLTQELDAIAQSIDPASPDTVEFHAAEIFGGRKPPWSGLKIKNERQEVIERVLSVLANDQHGTTAFACAIHKASFPNRDPMEMAFEQLCARFDSQLARMHKKNDTQRGLIILDETSYETTLQRLAMDFRKTGHRWGVLRNLSEVPLFVNSRASRCVQLADHVAYAVFRRYNAKDTRYLDRIVHKFDEEDGRIHGLVHMQTCDPRCMCPACLSRKMA